MNYLRKTFLWILILPYALGFLGAASNQLVFLANDGVFPVRYNEAWLAVKDITPGGMTDDRHCVMTQYTHLNLLADVFNFGESMLSIGDLLIDASDRLLPYCWGMWIGIILYRRERDFDDSKYPWQTVQLPPLSDPRVCPCDCAPNEYHTYCHTCRTLYGIIYRSEYFTAHQKEWERDIAARKGRMGL